MGSRELALGIIGSGGIARVHARGIRDESPSVRLIAACDVDRGNLDIFCEEFPDLTCYVDYDEMLADESIDAMLIALPHDLHVDCCVKAFAEGKHVLVEKPIARTLAEADVIIQAARDADRMLMVGHNQRFTPSYRTIARLIHDGGLGDLLSVSIDHHQNFDRPAGNWWRSRERVGGGCVIGSGIHRLDLLNWYLGEPKEVFAYGIDESSRLEAEAVCTAVIKYESGAIAQFYCNWAVTKGPRSRTSYGEGVSVFGTTSTLYLEDPETLSVAERKPVRADIEFQTIKADPLDQSLWEHFAQCVFSGETPLTDGSTGRKALELVEAIYGSMESSLPVKLPLA